MEIHFQINIRKNVLTKNHNDRIIGCDLTKTYHFMSTEVLSKLKRLNVRRGFLKIFFPPIFQKFCITNVW